MGIAYLKLIGTSLREPHTSRTCTEHSIFEFEDVTSLISGIIFQYQFAQARHHHFLLVKVH